MSTTHIVFAGVTLAAAAAHADPYYGPPAQAPLMQQPLAPTDQYISFGAIAGVDTEGLFLEPQLELGRRITGNLWAHAIAFGGDNDDSLWGDPPTKDQRLEFGGGLELRPCFVRGDVCMDAGIDLAYRIHRTENDDAYDGTASVQRATAVVALEHLGFDIGSRSLRLRVNTYTTTDQNGVDGVAGVIGGVYTW